jgi:3-oxoacyl-[acyl-carrier protein] reductase
LLTSSSKLGGVDVLINNAGRHLTKYHQPGLFGVNFMRMFNCTLACRDSMRDTGGVAALSISSMAG